MARLPRAVVPDTPHHITQRGNGKQNVFANDKDREVYLKAFFDYASRYSLRVWGYCLMSNHVHFVAVPENQQSLARVFGRTHADYARYANVVRRSCGHFWQARFYSCALDPRHAGEALAYVERNPVRAGLVERAEEYPWSSAAAHCGNDDVDGLLDMEQWRRSFTNEHWRRVLELGLRDAGLEERIREATRRGHPLGESGFTERVSQALGRDVSPRPPGRPPQRAMSASAATG